MGPPKCQTPYCRNTAKKRASGRYRPYCSKCRSKHFKEKHPWQYHFNYHKQNAKRRKIPWELTFEQFKKIWLQSGKWEEKKAGATWEMHRLESDKGYTRDNIVIIKKTLHVEITAVENGWQVDFKFKGHYRTEEQQRRAEEIYGKAPF